MAFNPGIILKFVPLLPQLIDLITKLVGTFKKKHDPSQIEGIAGQEVKALAEAKVGLKAKEDKEWAIVKGED